LSERINLRAIIFAGVVLLLLGWPVYTYLSETISGGIHDRGAYKEVDLKALGFFEMDPSNASLKDVPAKYRQLDGQKVLLKGEIFAPHEVSSIKQFELVYSIAKCCFGGPPKVQERVFAYVPGGKTFEYAGEGYHEVMGTLHVTMKKDDQTGMVTEVYRLDAESVKPVK
jgi:hypothetical protein